MLTKSWMRAAFCAVALCAAAAHADSFPAKPVTMIVPYPAGGATDVVARAVSEQLASAWKQPVVVENTTGAGGLIGMQRLLKSDPDGHTLMFSNMSLAIIPLLHPKAGVDVVRDPATGAFHPVTDEPAQA